LKASDLRGRTPFTRCAQTSIEDDFLEALVTNKRRTKRYSKINPITSGGHGRSSEARHVLSFLLRRALGVFRIPGAYDVALKSDYFSNLSIEEIEGACKDIRRIYDHTQVEMSRHGRTIELVRGIGGLEASVCKSLLDEIQDVEIPYYFQSVTFFNHLGGAFSRNINVKIDCPVEWVWASIYTLKDLELPGSDEEVMVVCQSLDGVLKVPKENFIITPSFQSLEPLPNMRGYNKRMPDHLPEVISALMQDGFEPDKYSGHTASYTPGDWESRFARLGRKLDSLRSAHNQGYVYIRAIE